MPGPKWSEDLFGRINSSDNSETTFEQKVEEAENRAGVALYDFLVSSGMAEKMVKASHHATHPFEKKYYPSVEVQVSEVDVMQSKDGIAVVPRLLYLSDNGKQLQPVTPKFGRQYKTETEAKEASEKLWSGVSNADKNILVLSALKERKKKYQLQKEGCERELSRPDLEAFDREGEEMYLRQANAYIALFNVLEKNIASGSFTFVYDIDGGLRARLKDDAEIEEVLTYRQKAVDEWNSEE